MSFNRTANDDFSMEDDTVKPGTLLSFKSCNATFVYQLVFHPKFGDVFLELDR